ncbi:AAA family ATPase [Alkalicaulis satelles]|uniref:AAA family ATPase n=1 Tax=Alkalicaulis satelles TaxID=2609175 RepID=A0A5M6ZIH2_9PROT|nr:AAA family ATPase [Alkalicaulis satelles]KAA5804579.1 AAA family ATPase [Alkalicaulis satelles]
MNRTQLALDLALAPDYRAESYAVSEANASALALVNRWPRWRHGHLMLIGPAGAGKTHLSTIWAARADALRLDPATLAASLPQVGRGSAVLVEDCHLGVEEAALFHLINRAAGDAGVTVLMTAARAPEDWPVRLADLASRLKAAETAVLHEPDDALLRQVMEKLIRDRRTPMTPGVLDYLLTRMERSVEFARRLVAWLDREALARKGPVTRTLAREGLEALSSP